MLASSPPAAEDATGDRAGPASEAPTAAAHPIIKSDRVRHKTLEPRGVVQASLDDPFDRVVKHAALSQSKLRSLFARAPKVVALARTASVAASTHATQERFAAWPEATKAPSGLVLAYADPSPTAAADALQAFALPSVDETDPYLEGLLPGVSNEAALPDYQPTPDDTPVPLIRPRAEGRKPIAESSEPVAESREQAPESRQRSRSRDADDEADKAPAPVQEPVLRANRSQRAAGQQLAYARPDEPKGGAGGLFGNLFSAPRAKSGVAVYDVSAAKVYMPDGSVLEAHSGIGKMADNPRYANVKMGGPTPPHTYNLQMRERRFHGVEAIRMLPADGKNKHGRDGFLTHSYLLRGGRAESHGCVAFKDYNKFLNAFKKGKIKQLVVVSGGGKPAAMRVASNGRGA